MRRRNIFNTAALHVKCFDLKNANLRQREIVDAFCREDIKIPDGSVLTRIIDPIHVLLNQERLDRVVGNTALQNFIDSFRNQKNDPFAELKANCSDADLISLIKSRHLQSPAEILSWSNYMKNNIELFKSEVRSLVESQFAKDKILKEKDKILKEKDELKVESTKSE